MLKKLKTCILKTNLKNIRIVEYMLPILFGACVLGALTYYKLNFGIKLIESDSASDICYAYLLSKEGNLISNNWFFSTEIRLLDNELVFALLFRLFPDLGWWEIETIGTAIMNALLGLSGILLAYQLGWRHKSLWMFGFTLLPFGTSGFYYVVMHGCGYYVYAITQVFFILSLFFAIVNDKSKNKYWLWIKYILYLWCSWVAGMQGIRLLENLYIPLLLSSIAIFIYQANKDAVGNGIHNNFQYMKMHGRFLTPAFLGFLITGGGVYWKPFFTKTDLHVGASRFFTMEGVFNCTN